VIRAAILSLLAEVGYGALTMDAVAAEAGVGKATIYRRWRTKEDLVVDTIAEVNRAEMAVPNTGSLEGDLREMLHAVVAGINGSSGAATQALLSTIPHHPALAEAFRQGPLGVWEQGFDEIFARAEARGELQPGQVDAVITEAITAPLVQRWLVRGEPVTDAYADEVLAKVALPLLRLA